MTLHLCLRIACLASRMPTRVFQDETPHLARAQAIATEIRVDPKEHGESMNDTAVHMFEWKAVPDADSPFWTCQRGDFQDDDHVSHNALSSWKWMK